MEVKVYPAGPPKNKGFVVQWRSDSMPGPSFNYYETEIEAWKASSNMKLQHNTEFAKGYHLTHRVLTVIKSREGREACEMVARAIVEKYIRTLDKTEFEHGVLYNAIEFIPEPVEIPLQSIRCD